MCFYKFKYNYYEADHVFHTLSMKPANKMDYEIDNDNHMGSLWKHMALTITLNMFQMWLTMFPIPGGTWKILNRGGGSVYFFGSEIWLKFTFLGEKN